MKKALIFFLIIGIQACHKDFVATSYTFKETRINPGSASDSYIEEIIRPYKDSLDQKMNVVLAVSDTILTKSTPESDLGNLMCDLILSKSSHYYGKKVDFTILNNGGIRIPNLPKGNITLGKIVELMPFENLIDIVEVDGKSAAKLFDKAAAKGGWQVSGARYVIKDTKATDVLIGNMPLDSNKVYLLAISDYLAQGGDNCDMLVPLPKTILTKSLRDAIVDGLQDMTSKGIRVKSVLDGRVKKID